MKYRRLYKKYILWEDLDKEWPNIICNYAQAECMEKGVLLELGNHED